MADAHPAPFPPDTTSRLGDALRARCRDRRVPALSAAVGRAGEVAWAGTAGWSPADAGTVFRIGSITKPMTAVAVLRLVAAGRVGLNDPVGRHLPDAPAPDATLAHLLTHTAGLPAEPPGPWWERHGAGSWDELVASGVTPVGQPGERHHYSNVGYAVLGRLLEEAHGRSWDAVLHDEVWAPLGMSATGRTPRGGAAAGYAVHPHADAVLAEPVAAYGAMGPAGEVWSTPSDLVRFGSWLVGATDGGDDVLPLGWRRRMAAPRAVVDDGEPFAAAWGLGVSVHHAAATGGSSARRTVGHGGSVPGFTATLRADPATGEVVAVCGSSTAGFGDAAFLLDLLDEPGRGSGAAGGVDAEVFALTGTWYWGPTPYTLELRADGRLDLSAEGGRGTVFGRSADGGWIGVQGGYWWGERLRPVTTGTPAQALDVGTFHLTRVPYDPATPVPGGVDPAGWSAAGRAAGHDSAVQDTAG
ncbi:serine hydrolase domain-containing protein [Krasilnikoviella flava]|uniref:CubicO group peptidase, beta-lactamase class C family n=1 Tax=Krasilnikoviella flava TaxID=526729 RepID=A0A1T5I7F4_9MICO|nr:serine hydrolase domain-containing protein [Krasilnikoviella flava]SKC35151.1 CubicO group peptidase, beta-lactamase class C family [Krasilnikoviella flava]